MPRAALLALGLVALFVPAAGAHYNMLLLQPPTAKMGQKIEVIYQWGHPFEHQLFNAPMPESVFVLSPKGTKTNLTPEKFTQPAADDKQVDAYRLTFTPSERGDYTFALSTPPIWMADEEEYFQDTVKVVLHAQVQKGWDRATGLPFELVPVTRPYGLEPGLVFQAQVLAEGKPQAGALVEVEHYNATPPKELPPDEQITRTMKTDPGGVATCNLTEPGWWCVTAQQEGGQREHDGKQYPVRRRTMLWVYVDAAPGK